MGLGGGFWFRWSGEGANGGRETTTWEQQMSTDTSDPFTPESYESLLRFLDFSAQDADRVKALAATIQPSISDISVEVAGRMLEDETVSAILDDPEGHQTRAQVDASVHHLLDGCYDEDHREARIQMGREHQAKGMQPAHVVASYSHMLCRVFDRYSQESGVDPDVAARFVSLLKVGMLDLAIVMETQESIAVSKSSDLMTNFSMMVEEAVIDLIGHVANLEESVGVQNGTAQQQASAVAEVTSSLSELRQTSAQARIQSKEMLEVSEHASVAASRGGETIRETIEGMESIRERVEVIQERICALTDQTRQIGDIIATVNEVAEQSKLLALNASIEAARAGEYGRSFSVVANEMRDLAEQSKQATRQVRELLSGIQNATTEAVVATEEGIQETDRGRASVRRTGELLEELGEAVSRTADASRLIASASRQQGEGVSQVADAMVEIDQSLRETVAATEGTSESVGAFSSTVDKLLERVTTYVMFGGEDPGFDDAMAAR